MPMPKTLREHLEDGTLSPLRTRAQVEREEELLARIAELEAALAIKCRELDEAQHEVDTLRAHRCEVGMENHDTFLKHLQSLSPAEREELRNITNPRY